MNARTDAVRLRPQWCPWRGRVEGRHDRLVVLLDALEGASLTEQDRRVLSWLAEWDAGTVTTIAQLIRRAGEVEALAGLLAEVVELAGNRAVFPGHWAQIAELAMGHDSVRRAILAPETAP